MDAARQRRLALASLLAGAACIGLGPIWVRISVVGPVATGFHRMALSLPFLFLWTVWDSRRLGASHRPSSANEAGWMAAAGLLFAGDLWSWHLSIHNTSVANSTLLLDFAPVVVATGSWMLWREAIGKTFWTGFLLAISGAAVLVGPDIHWGSDHTLGDCQGLVTAGFFGGYQLCVKRLRRTRPVSAIMFGSGLVASLPLLAIASMRHETILPANARGWGVVLALAFTAQIVGQSLIAYGFAHLPGGYSSLTLLVQPVVAAFAGWFLLGEVLGPRQLLGAGLVLAGVAWPALRRIRGVEATGIAPAKP